MENQFIQTKSLYALLEIEPFLLISSLGPLAWIFYKFFLKEVSNERHLSLNRRYKSLLRSQVFLTVFFLLFLALETALAENFSLSRLSPYLAVAVFFIGGYYFIQATRIVILQYLFLGSMRAGVPLLIVNIFSLGFTMLLVFWGATRIFNLNLAPLVATSAALSLIMGLALQDTLGNLFAGISLQIDHVYEIGDWIEVHQGNNKIPGQVKEVTWRATTLVGWTDEIIVFPNRILASSQISNFSQSGLPIVRSQLFKLPHSTNIQKAKQILLDSINRNSDVRKYPEPVCLITDSNESWIMFKLIYYIDNYGSQYTLGDKVFTQGLNALNEVGLGLANHSISLLSEATIIKTEAPHA